MKKFAAIAVAASMFALAACKEALQDPTPSNIDEPDQVSDETPCSHDTGSSNAACDPK